VYTKTAEVEGASEPAAELELLDDVTDLFESVDVLVLARGGVRDDEEGRALEQHHFISLADGAELLESPLDGVDVGDERVHNRGPGLVEGLVPDRRGEERDVHRQRCLLELALLLCECL